MYTKSMPNHHCVPFVTLTHTQHSQSNCTAGWWNTSGKIGLPPLAMVKGVGRQNKEVKKKWGYYDRDTTENDGRNWFDDKR